MLVVVCLVSCTHIPRLLFQSIPAHRTSEMIQVFPVSLSTLVAVTVYVCICVCSSFLLLLVTSVASYGYVCLYLVLLSALCYCVLWVTAGKGKQGDKEHNAKLTRQASRVGWFCLLLVIHLL